MKPLRARHQAITVHSTMGAVIHHGMMEHWTRNCQPAPFLNRPGVQWVRQTVVLFGWLGFTRALERPSELFSAFPPRPDYLTSITATQPQGQCRRASHFCGPLHRVGLGWARPGWTCRYTCSRGTACLRPHILPFPPPRLIRPHHYLRHAAKHTPPPLQGGGGGK